MFLTNNPLKSKTPSYDSVLRKHLPTEEDISDYLNSASLDNIPAELVVPDKEPILPLLMTAISLLKTFNNKISVITVPAIVQTVLLEDIKLPIEHNLNISTPPAFTSSTTTVQHFQALSHNLLFREVEEKLEKQGGTDNFTILASIKELGYIKTGPEKKLIEEIETRKEQYPNCPLYVLIGTGWKDYLNGVYNLKLIKERLPQPITFIEVHPPTYYNNFGMNNYEFAAIARPQVTSKLAISLQTAYSRGQRSWNLQAMLKIQSEIYIRPLESKEEVEDTIKFSSNPLIKRFSNFEI